jgi:hypothetical protein
MRGTPMRGSPTEASQEGHAYERHAHGMHAYARHTIRGTPMRGPRERLVHNIHVFEALTTPAEKEQLEPFYKLLKSQRRRQ